MTRVADGSGFRYGQGKLVAWNPDTFENTVLWNGATRTNVTVLAGPAALSFAPGQNVTMVGNSPSGGASSWGILGHWVTPGSGAAAAQIDFMTTALAKSISLAVLGEAIRSEETAGEVVTTSTGGAFVSLSGGPAITNVNIGSSGRALVIASAALFCAPTGQDSGVTCYMGYEITGETSVAASTAKSVHLGFLRGDGDPLLHPGAEMSASKVSLADSLNEGAHTFTAKYRVDEFNGSDEGAYLFRNLTVIPF